MVSDLVVKRCQISLRNISDYVMFKTFECSLHPIKFVMHLFSIEKDECKPVFMHEPSPETTPTHSIQTLVSPTGQAKNISTLISEGSKEVSGFFLEPPF